MGIITERRRSTSPGGLPLWAVDRDIGAQGHGMGVDCMYQYKMEMEMEMDAGMSCYVLTVPVINHNTLHNYNDCTEYCR